MEKRTTATITWHENPEGHGFVSLVEAGGGRATVLRCDEPINAATNSEEVASLFECHTLEDIDHDGECIHCVVVH